eukprot:CAMPEP_0172905500 /NCGR_PEP_ID=MMETSP1075-20121228/174779_1 /TAXON_ID=2916 /ORGANISM="Ceratium fusus, Strain PA161109" /LENGTH=70 /DNA_ID=CAMNT_0013762743 /DNA_START=22 /DNA_END=232 /DNA_ORIENTATION=+
MTAKALLSVNTRSSKQGAEGPNPCQNPEQGTLSELHQDDTEAGGAGYNSQGPEEDSDVVCCIVVNPAAPD